MDSKPKALTETETTVLAFVTEQISASGSAPTLKEIAEKMGWNAHSTAAGVVERLRQKGLLRRRKGYAIKLKKEKS